jgi:drug/metabolite transporter (DMT)-like permease
MVADARVACAVVAASWCCVEGASVTKVMPGWQVISWVVVLVLPVTLPAYAAIWWATHSHHDPTAGAWTSLVLLGVSSMYLGFFAWYRGLALAGTRGWPGSSKPQALLTLVWSALPFSTST